MFKHTRTALKFFVYGLAIGLLFAPSSGEETRRELLNRVKGLIGG
ncbi:MAG: YtxH domain-containing protein [Thermomicrobiales bacterium]